MSSVYEWVKFCSAAISLPENVLVLGKYLGPLIEIGPTMTIKILTSTGKVLHYITCRPLKPEELADPDKQDHMKAFPWMAEGWWDTHLLGDNLRKFASVYLGAKLKFMKLENGVWA